MDRIVLKNMAFYGNHGNLPEEQVLGQRFFADVTMCLDLTKAGTSDMLEDTINYAEVYSIVARVIQSESYHLLERVATVIADELWSHNDGIIGVSVSVRKPSVPIQGILDYAEVTINRGQI